MACETGNDAAMFFHEAGGFKGLPELLPLQRGVGGNPGLLIFGQRVHGSSQRPDRFFHTFIGWRKFELCVERFQMRPELLAQALQGIL